MAGTRAGGERDPAGRTGRRQVPGRFVPSALCGDGQEEAAGAQRHARTRPAEGAEGFAQRLEEQAKAAGLGAVTDPPGPGGGPAAPGWCGSAGWRAARGCGPGVGGVGGVNQQRLGSPPRGGWGWRRPAGALLVWAGLLLAGCLGQAAVIGGRGGGTLPAEVYPPSVPARHEGFFLAAACPNPKGLERPPSVEAEELLRVLEQHTAAVRRG